MNAYVTETGSSLSNRILQALTIGALLVTGYGLCLRAENRYQQWSTERRICSVLSAIHARQVRFREASRMYAPTLEALRMPVPEGIDARLYVGRMGGQPGYVAEACARDICWLVNQNGDLLRRQEVSSAPLRLRQEGLRSDDAVAAASEDPGRRVASVPGTEGVDSVGLSRAGLPSEPGRPATEGGEGSAVSAQGPEEIGDTASNTQAGGREAAVAAAKTIAVVPAGDAAAYGLRPGTPLPPLSPTRNTTALWGSLKEVKR